MKFAKFLALSIAAIAMVACGPAEEDPNDGPGFITQQFTKVYCDVSATGWETVGVWAWTDATEEAEGQNFTGGAWPGVALTTVESVDGKSYYVWEAPKELVGQTIGFIVNQFVDGGEQTIDLKVTVKAEGNFVVLTEKDASGKWLASVDGEDAVAPEPEPEKPAPSMTLDGHTWDIAGSFNSWGGGLVMSVANGWAVASFDAEAGAEFKVRADNGWDISYGVTDNSNLPVDGSEFDAIFNAGNLKVAEAGNYTLSFAINGEVGKFKLKKN